jgi:hypothetical protein
LALALQGPATSFALSNPQFGTTYYWQVAAQDSYGATAATPVQSLLLMLQNTPPAAFSVVSGTGTLSARTTSQLLSWQTSTDPDGDLVTYGLFLSSTPASLALAQLSTATSFSLGFQYGATYYWIVDAYDGFGGTTAVTGGTQTFVSHFLNNPPSPLILSAPFTASPVVKTMKNLVSVSWNQVSNPENDPITYTVYFGDAGGNLPPLATVTQTRQNGATAQTLRPLQFTPQAQVQADSNTVTLDYYKKYYVRIAASTPYGATATTPVQSFTLASPDGFPTAYNYPNPFSPLRGGTNIVFNAPPSGYAQATVEVYSEWQDLLFRQDYRNVPPGISQVHFDGRDKNGRAFFNGSYICRVRFSGPDDKQIFYMLVVK